MRTTEESLHESARPPRLEGAILTVLARYEPQVGDWLPYPGANAAQLQVELLLQGVTVGYAPLVALLDGLVVAGRVRCQVVLGTPRYRAAAGSLPGLGAPGVQ